MSLSSTSIPADGATNFSIRSTILSYSTLLFLRIMDAEQSSTEIRAANICSVPM